jgi:Domain of unknown function (DUF4129)
VTRPFKAGALALGLVALLVLVAMAARGSHPGAKGDVATHAVPDSVQDVFITLLVVAYIVVIAAIIIGFFRYKSRWHDPGSNWLSNFALITLLMLLATAIGYYGMTHSNLRKKVDQAIHGQGQPTQNPSNRKQLPPIDTRHAEFQWPLVLALGGFLLLGGVWVYVRRRGERPAADEGSLEADIVAAIETTIDDLRSERDARKAVIAAYALMERTLTSHGLARRRAETPMEYLGRILRSLNVRESAVQTLTELFEYAKFSRHEIDAAMKEQAIDALLAVREDVQREQALAA